MKLVLSILIVAGLAAAEAAEAGIPVEREVQTVRAVQVYSPGGQSVARPIGTIDFSSSGSASKRFGPWDKETNAFRDAEGVIFYDDGSASGSSLERQYDRGQESRCTTLGNVTVCR